MLHLHCVRSARARRSARAQAHRHACADAPFFEVSAKTRVNIEEIFQSLVRQIKAKRSGTSGNAAASSGAKRRTAGPKKKCIIL